MSEPITLNFPHGKTAQAVIIDEETDLPKILTEMGLPISRPVMVIVGGASKMSDESMARLHLVFTEVLAPIAESLGACVVDGGTDSGVMQMIGEARNKIGGTFPLVGVSPVGKVKLPDSNPSSQGTKLEPNHNYFVLIPGVNWGDESPWIARLATVLAADCSSVTVLANGGEVAWVDVLEGKKAGRLLIVLGGSGRLADKIVQALASYPQVVQKPFDALFLTNNLTVFDLSQPCQNLSKLLQQKLAL